MKNRKLGNWVAALGILLGWSAAMAEDFSVTNAWAKAPAPGQQVIGVYFTLQSERGGALVRVSSPLAKAAEMHFSQVANGVMEMRPVDRIDVPPGQTVTLAPSGTHVMLMDVSKKLVAGDRISMVATFENYRKKKVQVMFKALVKNE
jgi:copper(I)-binding protein